jgi:hypothetical protein
MFVSHVFSASLARQAELQRRPTDIGEDFGMPVTSDYAGDTSKFNGKIDQVQIDLGADNHDHLINPDELIRIAMARQ